MCQFPIILRNKQLGNGKNALTTPVPCGKCVDCSKAKFNAWLFRLQQELKISTNPLFVTLTYNDESLTYAGNYPTLIKRDVQLFMKLLRFNYEKLCKQQKTVPNRLRYYCVGEYGGRSGRPHYHLILYNLDATAQTCIEKSWPHGFALTLPVRDGGIPYVLKYLSKPRGKYSDGREREFSLMSKGLGANYLTPAVIKFHTSAIENCHLTLHGGIKNAMPKYYKDKIYCDKQRLRVTAYLKQRAERADDAEIRKLMATGQYKNVNDALKYRELSLKSKTFDKQLIPDVL